MTQTIIQVDAFSNKAFSGNPAAAEELGRRLGQQLRDDGAEEVLSAARRQAEQGGGVDGG